MTKRYKILLDPGHGATAPWPKGKFSRPLMMIDKENPTKVIKVCGSKRHPNDGRLLYYREDIGTLAIAYACKKALEELDSYDVFLTRNPYSDTNPNIYLGANNPFWVY